MLNSCTQRGKQQIVGCFPCTGLKKKPVCSQSSAMEILLGPSTQLHSLRPNQVVSELQSSYAAWLDHTSPRRYCSFRHRNSRDAWAKRERRLQEGLCLLFHSPASLLNLDPSACKCIGNTERGIMHVLLLSLLRGFINASMQSQGGMEISPKELHPPVPSFSSFSPHLNVSSFLPALKLALWESQKGWHVMSRPWKSTNKDVQSSRNTPLGPSHFTEGNQGSFHAFSRYCVEKPRLFTLFFFVEEQQKGAVEVQGPRVH